MKDFYRVYEAEGEKSIWVLPADLMEKLGLEEDHDVLLKAGSLDIEATVVKSTTSEANVKRMGLSKETLNALKIPIGVSLEIKFKGYKNYQLGPIIGIMTFMHVVKKGTLGRYTPYTKKMNGKGFLYVFGTNRIKPETKTILGSLYNETTKKWIDGEFPYPEVVIDRVYPSNQRAHRKLEAVIGPKRICNKKNLISKVDFHNGLIKDRSLRSYLPETRNLKSSDDLKYFLKKYGKAFLKPVNGMKGKGIVLVTPAETGMLCHYMEGKESRSKMISDPKEIHSLLNHVGKYKRPYIIQQGITRLEYKNSPCNFRTMVVKDGQGQWIVPAIFARVAKPGGFLTNSSLGADFILLKDLFEEISNKLPYSEQKLMDSLVDLSIGVAKRLDRAYGPLGKLGLDIIVDPKGLLWLIEANGNPGLMPKRRLKEYPDWQHQMYEYPIQYSLYLAGYNPSDY